MSINTCQSYMWIIRNFYPLFNKNLNHDNIDNIQSHGPTHFVSSLQIASREIKENEGGD